MADALDNLVDQALALGATADQIKARAEARSSNPTKQYFLEDLVDARVSPTDYAVKLTVTNWASIVAFFRKPPTEEHHPQRVYQTIRQDISDAIAARDAQKLILSLFMGAKASS